MVEVGGSLYPQVHPHPLSAGRTEKIALLSFIIDFLEFFAAVVIYINSLLSVNSSFHEKSSPFF
ncbi:Uncharacterised protein [Mycobacteroides abscessus subsp. abscessus]|nr:Uncharacterised protein [Mycobacteroides abscessus subsp. abscessus]